MKLHENSDVFEELILITAQQLQVPQEYVEKDYWVTRALMFLSQSAYANQVVFKGGTALSKAYHLVNRFSEDIDLAACCVGMTGANIKKLLKNAELATMQGLIYQAEHPRESKGSQFRKTIHAYPRLNPSAMMGQVSPHLMLEINAFTTPEPADWMPICSLIAEVLVSQERHEIIELYQLMAIRVKVLAVERTLAEKIMGLVRACREVDPVNALHQKIRHVYDICMILREERYKMFLVSDAFTDMIKTVMDADRLQFSDAGIWLDQPLGEALLFSDPTIYWPTMAVAFNGSFADMLYDDDLPNNEEVVAVFSQIGQRLASL